MQAEKNAEKVIDIEEKHGSEMGIIRSRRFWPLFLTQFLGAFNDNVFKAAMMMLIAYRLADEAGLDPAMMPVAAAGIFILPFFLFSALAGQLADKYEKARLIRGVKLWEIGVMLFGSVAFFTESISLLMVTLFVMGMQSTFFGPIKYGILPDHLKEHELVAGNSYISGSTFLSILFGTIIGGMLINTTGGAYTISAIVLTVAAAGYAFSRYIPPAGPAEPGETINWNLFSETFRILKQSMQDRRIFLCIIGISWFWFLGASFIAQFPGFARERLGADENVATLFMAMFSIGIGLGAWLCAKLLRGHVQATFVPLGALGMTAFIYALCMHTAFLPVPVDTTDDALLGIAAFLHDPDHLWLMGYMVALAACGGLYIVPLNALLQHLAPEETRSRIIAANNIMSALFMVASSVSIVALLGIGASILQIFFLIGMINLIATFIIMHLLPQALIKSILQTILRLCYRVKIDGLENYARAGERVLVVANHQSFLDAVLLASFLPDKLVFAINSQIAERWWVKPWLSLAEALPIDPANPLSARTMIDKLKEDQKVVIFPEGRITITGALMKVYDGPGLVADKSDAMVLPIRIDGAQYTHFSRITDKVKARLFPEIRLSILPPHKLHAPEELKGRKRRKRMGEMLQDVMIRMMVDSTPLDRTIPEAIFDAAELHGPGHQVLDDVRHQQVGYRQMFIKGFALGRRIARHSEPEERIGLMLPNLSGTPIAIFAMQFYRRVPAILNFSAGGDALCSACRTAQLRRVYTSRAFVEAGKLEKIIEAMQGCGVHVVYLEDFRREISLIDKLSGLMAALSPKKAYRKTAKGASANDPAVVLFTSGSEGEPKGVVLSHRNIQANAAQAAAVMDFNPKDILFNALPMFHSFGFTVGTMLPILFGIRVYCYPTPLHYRIIPELIYDSCATIMFGTDTFLSGYARFAHPYDLRSVRFVFAGAEKLRDETRRLYADKFGVRVLEGYGATETAPILTANTPMFNRPGSVGRLMPGMEYRLEPVPGIEEGGRLMVRGPNIMLGYLLAKEPGKLIPPEGGWYDTGDIVSIDAEGYMTIQGRAKRFAKIGGEMVSLAYVESYVARLWPEEQHAVAAIPDEKKGEQLVLVTEREKADRAAISAYAKENGITELAVPKQIITVKKLPLLGSGKPDHPAIRELVEEKLGEGKKKPKAKAA